MRTVIEAGDLFWFPGGEPTGFETPFDEDAIILIVKSGGDSYDDMVAGMRSARDSLAEQAAAGTPFFYRELPADHAAREFARRVAGRDPAGDGDPA